MKTLAQHLGVVELRPETAVDKELPFDENMSDAEFCNGVIMSRAYRASLLRRIEIDELPPAVELMLWDRARGTRKKVVEVDDRRSVVDSFNEQELVERELMLTRHLLQLKKRTNETSTSSSDDEDAPPSRVH